MHLSAKTVNFISVSVLIFVLLLAEFWLRVNGSRPGFIYQGVEEVDSLVVLPTYFTDTGGIQKISDYGIGHINNYVAGIKKLSVENIQRDKLENDLSSLAFDFYCLQKNYTGEQCEQLRDSLGISSEEKERKSNIASYNRSEFKNRVSAVLKNTTVTSFDSILLAYIKAPVNNSGFKSIKFNTRINGKKRILLLGDSHTWGRNGNPCFNSFADILLSRGYLVYNTGIVSTDPVQYLTVLKRYVDSIQPHLVILNFFVNDKMAFHHSPSETYHHTNAGLLSAYPHNVYLNAQQAYNCELEDSKVPLTSTFNRFCSTTALGTRLWCFVQKQGWVSSENSITMSGCKEGAPDAPFPVSLTYIQQAREVCHTRGVNFVVSTVPNIYTYSDRYPSVSFERLFDSIPFYQIKSLTPDDYSTQNFDDHLNNSGHLKYANFIQELIGKSDF